MGVLSFLKKEKPQTKEEKILSILRNLRELLTSIKANFPTEDKIPEELFSKVLEDVTKYNSYLRTASTLLFRLDKNLGNKLKDFYIPETTANLIISQKSPHSTFEKTVTAHKKLDNLIQEEKIIFSKVA